MTTDGMVEVIDRCIKSQIADESIDEAITKFGEFQETFPDAAGAKSAVELALLDL